MEGGSRQALVNTSQHFEEAVLGAQPILSFYDVLSLREAREWERQRAMPLYEPLSQHVELDAGAPLSATCSSYMRASNTV